ncbi:MAG: uroporphyrinogen decarboxylase family protein, partial [Polyangia bacterium]
VAVKFFHNDAECAKSIGYYPEIGINLYNPGIFHTLADLRRMSANRLAILGNIPPRDVLAKGSPADVVAAVKRLLAETADRSKLILSCAGGMPPGVPTENLRAFIEAAQEDRAGCPAPEPKAVGGSSLVSGRKLLISEAARDVEGGREALNS